MRFDGPLGFPPEFATRAHHPKGYASAGPSLPKEQRRVKSGCQVGVSCSGAMLGRQVQVIAKTAMPSESGAAPHLTLRTPLHHHAVARGVVRTPLSVGRKKIGPVLAGLKKLLCVASRPLAYSTPTLSRRGHPQSDTTSKWWYMDTAIQRAAQVRDDDHAEAPDGATSGAAPLDTTPDSKRGRGRPRNPTRAKLAFDAGVHSSTIATIKAIPENRRNAVRDEAIALLDRNKTVRASHKVVFAKIAREVWWEDGVFLRSNAWLAKECGTSQRNVEFATGAFRDAGWVSRRERKTQAGDHQTAETTIPLFAQVWADMRAQQTAEEVPNENSGVPNGKSNFSSGGTEPECGQPSDSPQEKEKELYGTPSLRDDGSRALQRERTDDQDQIQPLSPDRVTLSGWKGSTPFFRDHDFAHDGPVAGVMNLETWRRMLHQYGGAPQHLTTPATHQQALGIGHELSAQAAEGDAPVAVLHAMLALAAAICDAHAQGKRILSLGFIVDRLARRARYDGDPAWAHNLPRRRDLVSNEEFEAAFELARKACDAIDTWEQELSVDRDQLLGTWEVECLAWSGKHFGRGALVDAMKHVRDQRMWAGKLLELVALLRSSGRTRQGGQGRCSGATAAGPGGVAAGLCVRQCRPGPHQGDRRAHRPDGGAEVRRHGRRAQSRRRQRCVGI